MHAIRCLILLGSKATKPHDFFLYEKGCLSRDTKKRERKFGKKIKSGLEKMKEKIVRGKKEKKEVNARNESKYIS